MDFAEPGHTAIPLVKRYANLLVIRTFSKSYSLSGARVGYCFGNEKLIRGLEVCKALYNVNALSQRLALAALRDRNYMLLTSMAVRATRDRFAEGLAQLGFNVVSSQANFVLCSPPAPADALFLYESLMKQSIFIRYFDHPRLRNHFRISIGTDEEMDRLLAVLCRWLRV
jgi:histidinol-phosphate aminotransferase